MYRLSLVMSTSEKILNEIFDDSRWVQKILIGGLLSFIPIVNLFVFGYITRYAHSVGATHSYKLPEWDDWGTLLKEGLHFFIVSLLYFLMPLGIAMIFAMILGVISLGLLCWLPVSIVYFASPPIILAVIHRLDGKMNWKVLINLGAHLEVYAATWKRFIFPTLALIGLQVFAFPLFGFTFFLGFVPYTAYATHIFTSRVEL